MTSFLALSENIRRHRRSLLPSEACLVAGQALLDHAELNSETFVLRRLTRRAPYSEKSIQALAVVQVQGFCRSARSHRSPHSSPYVTWNMSVCSRPVEKAAHSVPRELLTTRRILRDTDTVKDSPCKMFGCATMVTLVDDPLGRFAQAASATVSQTNDDGTDTIHHRDPASVWLRASTC